MVKMLKKIYHRFSKYSFVKWLGKVYLNGSPWGNYIAYRKVKKRAIHERKIKNSKRKIKVAFIEQNISVWGKTEAIFERLSHDNQFDVRIYAVSDISDKDKDKSYEYWRSRYDNVITVEQNGEEEGESISAFAPDYTFFTRPYDQYLPKKYRSTEVAKYSKVCYCSYSFMLTWNSLSFSFGKNFARNVSIFFAENEFIRQFNENRFRYSHKKGIRKSLFLGYPIMGKMSTESKGGQYFSIMWAPRWSTSNEIGGSSFFDYKDSIVKFVTKEEDIRLLFRPHPLAFYHFIQTGEMKEDEVEKYLSVFDGERMVYDKRADYENTFSEADVLISDISSMIPEFYVSKKPIVYCDKGADVLPIVAHLLEGCYISHNWKETEQFISQLRKGIDPLSETRSQISDEVFGKTFKDIPDRFADYLYQDFYAN